jgi:hypothetical protein
MLEIEELLSRDMLSEIRCEPKVDSIPVAVDSIPVVVDSIPVAMELENKEKPTAEAEA